MIKDLYIILLASGVGKRFSQTSGKPKQLHKIQQLPLLMYSINTARSLVPDEQIILTYPEGMSEEFAAMAKENQWSLTLVKGGERRQDSVFNAFQTIQGKNGIVLIHDTARPLASAELFKRVYEDAKKHRASIPVIKSPDTVKELGGRKIKKTIDRNKIGLAQTPQGFNIELLREVFLKFEPMIDYTDEAGLLERHGVSVHTVDGERTNLKLTFKEDLVIIKALIHEQNRHRD